MNKDYLDFLYLWTDEDHQVKQHVIKTILENPDFHLKKMIHLKNLEQLPFSEEKLIELEFLINSNIVFEKITKWKNTQSQFLCQGLYWLEKLVFPNLCWNGYQYHLQEICKTVWLEHNKYLTNLEIACVIQKLLREHYKFSAKGKLQSLNEYSLNHLFNNKFSSHSISLILVYYICSQLEIPTHLLVDKKQKIHLGFYPIHQKKIVRKNHFDFEKISFLMSGHQLRIIPKNYYNSELCSNGIEEAQDFVYINNNKDIVCFLIREILQKISVMDITPELKIHFTQSYQTIIQILN